MFNATIFIILKAYVGMATDEGASCWAKQSSVLFFFFFFLYVLKLVTTESGKLLVTFVKDLQETLRLAAATVQACG